MAPCLISSNSDRGGNDILLTILLLVFYTSLVGVLFNIKLLLDSLTVIGFVTIFE